MSFYMGVPYKISARMQLFHTHVRGVLYAIVTQDTSSYAIQVGILLFFLPIKKRYQLVLLCISKTMKIECLIQLFHSHTQQSLMSQSEQPKHICSSYGVFNRKKLVE